MARARLSELEAKSLEIGRILKGAMPPGVGFFLVLSEFGGPGGWLTYLSSIKREDAIALLEEMIERLKEPLPGAKA